jgi:uncharacterized hydrophobic protein (TIGR00271 family)
MEPNLPQENQSTPESAGTSQRSILISLWDQFRAIAYSFLGERFSIIDVAQPESTIEGIKKDVEFRGFALWILIFSIFIASIGLNVNSTAVVIGAMLISPLMGPIMGVGLSIGIYDFDLLWKSLKNLGVAVGIGLITSAIYFFISPISAPSNELFARTNPTLLDVMVAFFGGLAGILAGSRKEKSNVIPGVAIATALMPPLCTAGFGLAHGEWSYFFGALYLFLINSVLIAAATTIIVRYLKFPHVDIPDPVREKKISRYFTIAIAVVIIPSIWIFYRTVTNTLEQTRVEQFVMENVVYPGAEIVKEEVSFEGGKPVVDVVLFGELVPENLIQKWSLDFSEKNGGTLNIVQGKDDSNGLLEMSKLVNLYSEGRAEAKGYKDQINDLEAQLKILEGQLIPANLAKEVRVNYPDVQSMSLGTLQSGVSETHSGQRVPVAYIQWSEELSDSIRFARSAQLKEWLKLRLNADSVLVQ